MKTTTQRGYGRTHQILRERWKRLLKHEGELPCTRCGKAVHPEDQWELDHTDDRTAYLGIAHASCNRRAGGLKSQTAGIRKTVRRW